MYPPAPRPGCVSRAQHAQALPLNTHCPRECRGDHCCSLLPPPFPLFLALFVSRSQETDDESLRLATVQGLRVQRPPLSSSDRGSPAKIGSKPRPNSAVLNHRATPPLPPRPGNVWGHLGLSELRRGAPHS